HEVVCTLDKLLAYVSSHSVDEIFICTNNMDFDSSFKETLAKIEETGIKLSFKIKDDFFEFIPHSFSRIDKIGDYYCVSISRNYFSYRNIIVKHVMDFVGGLVGCMIFAVAFCILGPIIKLDSKGPILFKQQRVGRNGRIFTCYKFRSMRQDAEELKAALMKKNEMHGLMFKMEDDPRITKVGKFIRKTSLDELPQFINVLKGDMSLVGTRPPTVDEYQQYEPKQKARISMTPGLTGLWQVSGRSNIKNFDDVIRLDMLYIDNWSILLDIKIILLTIKVVLFGSGAK
ncbi:MAG: exopolysaccharide biosynthesis polyprenyl glycosylphosphotransferase, partial [Succinivibrio sp.]|nr:exopolysaccharide biosynthesis polyprenyl glycosylphosphotransferase [Succinivibrio sp.]